MDEYDIRSREPNTGICFVAVRCGERLPLVLARRYESSAGFEPGALLALETEVLFFGAGEWIMAYDVKEPRKLREDYEYRGFYAWDRHGDHVLMSAELEFAAYDLGGRRLWSRLVKSPWSYSVEGSEVSLNDVVGEVSRFPLAGG